MKRLIKIHFFMLVSIVNANNVFGYDIEVTNSDGVAICYNYINDGKDLEVTANDAKKYSGKVVIPEYVTYLNRTRKVTSIGKKAFFYCQKMTSITIPEGVTNIGAFAFEWCSNLTSVTIPNTVTNIDSHAFSRCITLSSITMGNSVKEIGDYAFAQCGALTSITIPSSVTRIGADAFQLCSGLTSVSVTDLTAWCNITFEDWYSSPLSLAKHLYIGGKEVKDLVIPNNVTSLGKWAFYGCEGLTSVTIPNTVTAIADWAFNECI